MPARPSCCATSVELSVQQHQLHLPGLNALKPAMIAEANQNARLSAEQFARDSGAAVGQHQDRQPGLFLGRRARRRGLRRLRLVGRQLAVPEGPRRDDDRLRPRLAWSLHCVGGDRHGEHAIASCAALPAGPSGSRAGGARPIVARLGVVAGEVRRHGRPRTGWSGRSGASVSARPIADLGGRPHRLRGPTARPRNTSRTGSSEIARARLR